MAQRIKNQKVSAEDFAIIHLIARRASALAAEYGGRYDLIDADMDLSAVHQHVPLRLQELLDADLGNFAHDVFGIRKHLNRGTLQLEDCFLPRFAQPQPAVAAV